MELKSLYSVPTKWCVSKSISSASVKRWICSVEVLQNFSCSSRSFWVSFPVFHSDFQSLLVLLQLLPGSKYKQFSFADLQLIYLGCEKNMLFTLLASDVGQLRFSSSFISIPFWGWRVGITESQLPPCWGWSQFCWSDPVFLLNPSLSFYSELLYASKHLS